MQKFKKGDALRVEDPEYPFYKGQIVECLGYDELNDCVKVSPKGYTSSMYSASSFTLHTPKQTDMIPEGLEIFYLETALKEPGRVVTRDGRSVKIAGYNPDANPYGFIAGWIGQDVSKWSDNGKYANEYPNSTDLFLRAVEVVHYFKVDLTGRVWGPYLTADEARTCNSLVADIISHHYRANQLVDVRIAHRFNEQL